MKKISTIISNCRQLQKRLSVKIDSMEKESFISVAKNHEIKVLKEFYSQISDLIELIHFYEMQNMPIEELNRLDFVRENIALIEKEHEETKAKIIGEYELEMNQIKSKYQPLEDNLKFVSAFRDFGYKKEEIREDCEALITELNKRFVLDKSLSYRILFDPKMISVISKSLSSTDQAIYDEALALIRDKKEDMPFKELSLQLFNVLKKSPILLNYMVNQTEAYNLIGEDLLKTHALTDDLKSLIYESRIDERENLMDIMDRVISGPENDGKSALDRKQEKYDKENQSYRNKLNRWKNESELRQIIAERKPNKIDIKKMHASILQIIRMYYGDEKLLNCCDQTLQYLNGLLEKLQQRKETYHYQFCIEMLNPILDDCRQNDAALQREQKRFALFNQILWFSKERKKNQDSISDISQDMKSVGFLNKFFSEKKYYQELKKKRKNLEDKNVDLVEAIKNIREVISEYGFKEYGKDMLEDNHWINNELYQKQYVYLEFMKKAFQLAPLEKKWKKEFKEKYQRFFVTPFSTEYIDIIGLSSCLQEFYCELRKEKNNVSSVKQFLSPCLIDVSFRSLLAQFIGSNFETLGNNSEDSFYVELLISFIQELKVGVYQNSMPRDKKYFDFILNDLNTLQVYLSCDGVLQQGKKRQRLNETLS